MSDLDNDIASVLAKIWEATGPGFPVDNAVAGLLARPEWGALRVDTGGFVPNYSLGFSETERLIPNMWEPDKLSWSHGAEARCTAEIWPPEGHAQWNDGIVQFSARTPVLALLGAVLICRNIERVLDAKANE